MESKLYTYRAQLNSVYDGDTCRLDIDLGLSIWSKNEKVRLARINAPELKGETLIQARQSRDFLRQNLEDQILIIETIRDRKGKYGRYIVEIWRQDESGNWLNINDLMVQEGFAREY